MYVINRSKVDKKRKKIAERRAKEKERKKKEEIRKETSTKSILTLKKPDESSETGFKDDASEEEYPEFKGIEISTYHSENVTHTPKKAKIAKLMTPELTSELDRTKMSNSEAVFTIAATATSLGHDTNDLTLSVSTIHRARKENRKKG